MLIFKDKRCFLIPMALVVIIALVFANMITLKESTAYAAQGSKTTQSKYRWQRSSQISSGKNEEALQFALEVSEYVNNKYPEITVRPYIEVFGTVGKVHWFVDYDSLATFERINSKLLSDAGFVALIKGAANLFIEGSGRDTMVMSIR
jgi:hypothetical protein